MTNPKANPNSYPKNTLYQCVIQYCELRYDEHEPNVKYTEH